MHDFKGTLEFVKKYSPGYFSPDVLNDVIAALELAIKAESKCHCSVTASGKRMVCSRCVIELYKPDGESCDR